MGVQRRSQRGGRRAGDRPDRGRSRGNRCRGPSACSCGAVRGGPVRRRLLRWGSWFALANAGLLALIGVRYLWHYAAPAAAPAGLYVLVATAGPWAALAYLPFLLVVAPVSLLVPRPRAILPLGV